MKIPANLLSHRYLFACVLTLMCGPRLQAAEVPYLGGRVNDSAEMLSSAAVRELEQLLKAHEDTTSDQIVVLTIPSLEGEDMEGYSIRVAETWKLGQRGKDNGVLLLVVRDDRKVRIEVGRGLEGELTDATCGIIIRHDILPSFKNGDYDEGVKNGITSIIRAIHGAYSAEESTGIQGDLPGILIASVVFFFVVGIFTLIALFTHGCQSWFLYAFLTPFWLAFPIGLYGTTAGFTLFAIYAIGFLVAKTWFARSDTGRAFIHRVSTTGGPLGALGGTWSSGGGSSSGSSFSGGGGSFSGGGASGSW